MSLSERTRTLFGELRTSLTGLVTQRMSKFSRAMCPLVEIFVFQDHVQNADITLDTTNRTNILGPPIRNICAANHDAASL